MPKEFDDAKEKPSEKEELEEVDDFEMPPEEEEPEETGVV